jgi:hypothetical protein
MANNDVVKALLAAADALDIACDWNLPAVQVNPPPEWNLDGGGEDATDGWCGTAALARKLREIAASPNCALCHSCASSKAAEVPHGARTPTTSIG